MLEDFIQLHRAGRLDEAENGYRQLLAQNPDDAEVLHLLGIVRGQRGDMHEALQLVQRAGELDPDNAACQHTLGEMYLREQALDEAAQAYDRARMLNPNLAAAHGGLGQVAYLRGDLDSAEQHFKVALRADENDVQALTGLGNVAQMRGDTTRALPLLTQAAKLAPNDPLIQASYARAMLDQGMPDFAAQAVDNALAMKPDYPVARALRAELHVRKGELTQALAIYESMLARGEQVAAARAGVGDVARAQGHHDEAIAQYAEALRVQPDLHYAAIRRADSLARSGRVVQAIGDLRRHIADHPGNTKAYIALAHLLAQTGRFDEALAVWASADRRWPDDIDLKAQHALTLDRAGRTDEALAMAERAATSKRPALAMLRARGALLAGDPAAAVQRLQRIDEAELEGQLPQLLRRCQRLLGLAFDALEQWPDAVRAFMAAQRTGTSLPVPVALDDATRANLQQLSREADLAAPRVEAPVLLCGLPGSGVARIAALLADQPGWLVRRERFESEPDFISAPFDPRLAQALDQTEIGMLARRYRRPLRRAGVAEDARIFDWIPFLDARVLPALRRALPGVRLVIVKRDLDDALVDWLAFGGLPGFALPDPLAGARWLRLAHAHLEQAAAMLPVFRADPDALLASHGEDARKQFGAFLGIDDVVLGEHARTAASGRGGLPAGFASGHASHYRETLADAFAVLDEA